jgi:Domain of unknown function (DUF1929)/Concanavalin A-like lectin/glucanases superfamily/Bacterial Ig-like domain (group 2)/Glyoxal oxidase N-terminus/Abnormal spindle-like microcephaly-assoc'd, ASPM-SPD-2-Hydin
MTRPRLTTRLSPQAVLVSAILLAGVPTAGAQTLNVTTISFGNIAINTPSAPKLVTLSNTQTTPLTINSIATSGDFAETSKCPIAPQTLAAGATCQIQVTFTPSVLTAETGSLEVNDNASMSPQGVQLGGTGVPPVTVAPASYSLGNQAVNTVGTSRNVVVTNYLTVPVTLTNVAVTGPFTTTNNCPMSPNTLAGRATCTIPVAFAPTAVGAATGNLTVTDTAVNSPQSMQLTGTGIAPVSFSPAAWTFPNQLVNTSSAAETFTLKNLQTAPLSITGISASGAFAQTSTCPISPNTLAAGLSCTISVTFTPTVLGTVTGALTVTDNGGTSPQVATLTGLGGLPGLTAISVAPATVSLFAGSQQQLTATATFTNGSTLNVTNLLNWSSSVPAFAQVSSTGLVQALAPGEAIIVSGYQQYSAEATVTVPGPGVTSLVVTPGKSTWPAGAYQQFSAILHYSNHTTNDSTSAVSWSSSTTTVGTVSPTGLASASSAGSTTIQASLGSLTGSATFTVTQPSCTAPPAGLTNWWTGDGNVVDLAGSSSGTFQNGAAYGNGEVAQAFAFPGNSGSVLVNSPVYSPVAGTLMFWFMSTGGGALTGGSVGGQNQGPGFLVDSGGNLDWAFGNLPFQSVGQVNPNQWYHVALTYSTSSSETAVSVYLNGVLVAESVADANTSWNPQVAFGTYLGGTLPSFVGSMDEIAVFNKALTSQQIHQIYGVFSSGMCKPGLQTITVSPASPNLAPGLTLPFDAVGKYSNATTHDVTTSANWNAANASVATVSLTGQVTGIATGNTTVSAALGSVQGSTTLNVAASLVSIQVSPQTPTTPVGAVVSFAATGTFSDGSQQNLTPSVSWSSSSPAVATITSNGNTTSLAAGQTTITATSGSVSGSAVLTVTSATLSSIAVTPGTYSIASGTVEQFTAAGTFSDGSQQNLTTYVSWGSSTSAVATVASSGAASGVGPGTAAITATLGSVTGTANLTVTTAVLTAIQISPQSPSVTIGGSQQFSATGIYSDGTSGNISASAQWTSSAVTVATMSVVSAGLAASTGTGTTIISASYSGLTASTTLTVQDQLLSITIAPATATLATGQTEQFSAMGIYASGVTQNLTGSATWSASAPGVAGVSSSGLATSLTPGQTSISASVGNIAGLANLTVGSPSAIGQWTTLSNTMPINPIHTALLNNGEVLIIAGSGNCSPNLSNCPTGAPYGPSNNSGALLVDPFTGQVLTQFTISWDMFCNGMALLQDGTVLIAGGNLQYNPFMGEPLAAIFNPETNTFTNLPNMAHGRWYPTVLTLANGTIMTFSGLNETGSTNSSIEFFTEGTGWSTPYVAPFTPDLYPRLHLLPNGTVFYSSATPKSKLFNPATNTWNTNLATTNYGGSRVYGSSVLLPLTPANNYDPQVMILGGGNPATNTTEIIDVGATTPAWVYGPNMSQARIEMNAVLLPTGNILALGGSLNNEDVSTASFNADLYNPATNTFSSAGANAFPRLYHSVALLLPDATVWVAGSNPTLGNYEHHMEIYQPAYLFNPNGTMATRPSISSAPSSISYGSSFAVTTPDAASIGSVVLIRNPTVTHAFGMDQREVVLSFSAGEGFLTVTAPPNGNIAPPGYYMLFLLNSSGVPSVAPFIQVTSASSGGATAALQSSTATNQSTPGKFGETQAPAQTTNLEEPKSRDAQSSATGPIGPPGFGIGLTPKARIDLRGVWSGTFVSKDASAGSFTMTVIVHEDSHGHLIGSSTLTSDCLKEAQLQVKVTGSQITLAGSNEAGDDITVQGALDKTGTALKASYILDGSATGKCETDAGTGTLTKQ